MQTVNVSCNKNYITVLCQSDRSKYGNMGIISLIDTLQHLIQNLYTSLKWFCRRNTLPSDKDIFNYMLQHNTLLSEVSDASLKGDQCSHAWILTTRKQDHKNGPLVRISGSGLMTDSLLTSQFHHFEPATSHMERQKCLC